MTCLFTVKTKSHCPFFWTRNYLFVWLKHKEHDKRDMFHQIMSCPHLIIQILRMSIAAAIHLLGMTILLTLEWTDELRKWSILVTSESDTIVPFLGWKTSEHWEVLGLDCKAASAFLAFKKRPPDPLGRRIAWRWREWCIYGCCKHHNIRQLLRIHLAKKEKNIYIYIN